MERMRHKVVLVDDEMTFLTFGRNLLRTFYEVYPAPSAKKLFEILKNVTPDLILLDITMPEMDGFEVIKILKADSRYAGIPVIFLTAKNDEGSEIEGLNLGAVDYISKPFSAPLLLRRIANNILLEQRRKELLEHQAALRDYEDNLEIKVSEKTAEILNLQNAVLNTIAELAEFRGSFPGGHVVRTQRYLRLLIQEVIREGLYADETSEWDLDIMILSAQLHDVGKIAVTDMILNKPAKLTPGEFEIMKTHVAAGVAIIERIISEADKYTFLHYASLFAGTHHERWDGTGYPFGLKGRNIPIEGRLMAIADVYGALVSDRPYKDAFTHEEACRIIEDGAGFQFDPLLVEVFKEVKGEFAKITEEIVD
jgi:putative two-component system response regulator